jgi:hypothetical protein
MNILNQKRQFIICKEPVILDNNWFYEILKDKWVISYQKDLSISIDRADPENPKVVIGNMYCHDTSTDRGAGRYALIRWPEVRTDPAALLSIFHARVGKDLAVSSSPNLALLALTGKVPPFDITIPLEHRGAINFIPMPATRWHNVRRLFCDQSLNLVSGALTHVFHGIEPYPSFEQAIDKAASELVRFAMELKERVSGRVFLPLTAGLDSRTIAAAFLAADLPFETVTFRFAGKPETDITTAAAISRKYGLRHHVLELEGEDATAGHLLYEHTAGLVNDWEISDLFPGNAYRYQRYGDTMIVAGCFEFGRQYYKKYFKDLDFLNSSGDEIWERRVGKPGPPMLTQYLDEWRDWRGAHLGNLDWSNAFYLDQRLSAWRATVEHGYDLLQATALHPANNATVLAALITPSPEDQLAGRLQHELIARLAPELARFPINPVSLPEKLRKLRRRMQNRVFRQFASAVSRRG